MVDKLLSSLQEGHDAEVQLCPVGHGAFQKLFVQSVHVIPKNRLLSSKNSNEISVLIIL